METGAKPQISDEPLFASKGRATPLGVEVPANRDDPPVVVAIPDDAPETDASPGLFEGFEAPSATEGELAPAARLLALASQNSVSEIPKPGRSAGAAILPADADADADEATPDPVAGFRLVPSQGEIRLPVRVRAGVPALAGHAGTPRRGSARTRGIAVAAGIVLAIGAIGAIGAGASMFALTGAPTEPNPVDAGIGAGARVDAGAGAVAPASAATRVEVADAVEIPPAGETGAAWPEPAGTAPGASRDTLLLAPEPALAGLAPEPVAEPRPEHVAYPPVAPPPRPAEMPPPVPAAAPQPVVPQPADKPDAPAPGPALAGPYMIQIASLPSAPSAREEIAKLRVRLAGLVAADSFRVRGATLHGGRRVFRVTVEGFGSLTSAGGLCRRVRERAESCLVVRVR